MTSNELTSLDSRSFEGNIRKIFSNPLFFTGFPSIVFPQFSIYQMRVNLCSQKVLNEFTIKCVYSNPDVPMVSCTKTKIKAKSPCRTKNKQRFLKDTFESRIFIRNALSAWPLPGPQ